MRGQIAQPFHHPALHLDTRLRLLCCGTIYDYSSWLGLGAAHTYGGSMFGFGAGATLTLAGVSVGVSAGGQFTFFPQLDDSASGPNGASLGPFISANAGYVLDLVAAQLGFHGVVRYRSAKDETNSIVYDPRGYQLRLLVSLGL